MTRPSFAPALLAPGLLAFAVAFATAFATAFAPGARASDLPAQLRPAAMIEADVIRLGDLWDNLGAKADTPIANAPQPGKRVTLEARWLAAVANAHGVDWRPGTIYERSVVERAGQHVDLALVETELREALALEGAPAGASVDIANRQTLQIIVPVGTPMNVRIRDLGYDPRMNRFTAVVEVPAGSPTATRVKVGGRVFATARIPVLTRALSRGDVIGESDIQWIEVHEENIRREVALSTRQLIGQEPRYQLRAGQPIRLSEIQRPILVPRGSMVTMTLKNSFMTLTTQGKAVEEGGAGDIIRVTNAQTKQTVEAKVDGPGMVSVAIGGPRLLSN